MRRLWIGRFVVGALIVILTGLTIGYAFEAYNDSDTVLTEDRLIEGDYIKAANRILNKGKITGDFIVAASHELSHEGIVEGDLIGAAAESKIAGLVKGDIRLAATNISIEGEINRNASMLANRIVQYKDSIIEGSIHAFSSHLDIRGYIGGDVSGANKSITISGTVKGNIYVYTTHLIITEDAQIEGNLIYVSDTEQSINPNQVKGSIEHRYPSNTSRRDFTKQLQRSMRMVSIFSRMILTLSYLIAGVLITLAFKKPYERAVAILQERPWHSIGLGAAVLICTPIVAIIVMITVIGIPFGLIALALYGILLYIAQIPVGIWLGSRILRGEKSLVLWFIVGTLILEAVKLLPYLGWLPLFCALTLGMGATLLMLRG